MKAFANKSILVTGAAGLCGHSAVRRLLDEGAYIRATTHTNRDIRLSDSRLETVEADLLDFEQCLSVTRDIDVVVHLAAYLRGAKGQSESPAELVRRNAVPSINIMDAAVKNRVGTFGFVGSSTSYPDVDHAVQECEGFSGEPHPVYAGVGWMKRYCEQVCRHLHDVTDTNFAMIRTTAVYGPYDSFDPEKCHAIPHLILKASRRNDPFEVWGDGTQVRDFVYVDDVVDGLLRTIEHHANADPLNIATGVGTTVTELVDTIVDQYQYSPVLSFNRAMPTMIPVRIVNVSRAASVIGWSSKVTLNDGIAKTIEWYEANKMALARGLTVSG